MGDREGAGIENEMCLFGLQSVPAHPQSKTTTSEAAFPAKCGDAAWGDHVQGICRAMTVLCKDDNFNDAIIYYTVCFSLKEELSPSR